MPLFAAFLGSLAQAFLALFVKFMGFKQALRLASYAAWITILTAFITTTMVCISSLYGMVSGFGGGGGGWLSYFWMGLGMFIPSNAAAVLSCIGSVWVATSVYKMQKDGLINFGPN